MVIGIMSAMDEEINKLVSSLDPLEEKYIEGGRVFYKGKLWQKDVVLVFSRWGKVAAATTVTTLISKYKVNQVIFTGVAGGVDENLKVGDIVIGNDLYQHDMDGRPLFKQFEIPLLNVGKLSSHPELVSKAKEGALVFFRTQLEDLIGKEVLQEFMITNPRVLEGPIASGDQFFNSREAAENLKKGLPDVICVEMEGAAVAQVCYEYQIPFVVIRTISDSANEDSHVDFVKFINLVASIYSFGVLKNMLIQ
jgi:adenosylhomocysteine nucleosidase